MKTISPPFVIWKEAYSVGSRELDAQHQAIFKLLNELYAVLQEGGGDKPPPVLLQEAAKYAQQHFETEEHLMALCGYPRLPEHQQVHRQYVRRVAEIGQDPEGEIDCELFLFLKDWWLNHVTQMDSEYAPFLKKLNGR